MAVDYVSTAPWNDPYNPWPQYAQLVLSATDAFLGAGQLLTLNLTYFKPFWGEEDEAQNYVYTSSYNQVRLFFDWGPQLSDNNPSQAYVLADADNKVYYRMYLRGPQLSRPRDVTVKPSGVTQVFPGDEDNGRWLTGFDYGDDAAALYIAPVKTSLAPWEYRRRRLLEYC